MVNSEAASLRVDFFDGTRSRPIAARIHVESACLVVLPQAQTPPAGDTQLDEAATHTHTQTHTHTHTQPLATVPLRGLRWPERYQAGMRLLHLPSGASVQCRDAAAWDAWVAAQVRRPASWVARAQQAWPAVVAALVLLIAVAASAYVWGVPWAARTALRWVPADVDQRVGAVVLNQLERRLFTASQLSEAEQRRWTTLLQAAVERSYPGSTAPSYTLHFRASWIGPNALALPGGTIVVTDDLIEMARAGPLADDMVIGVLGHEIGHVRHRHGMQHLMSASVLALVMGKFIGDYSTVLAGVPAWLGQASYSRDAEREADAESRRLLRAAGYSSLGMVRFFEDMGRFAADKAAAACRAKPGAKQEQCAPAEHHTEPALGLAISSHPPSAERIAAFGRTAGP